MIQQSNNSLELSVVMPVYNEEFAVESVIREWSAALTHENVSFEFLVINDGSRDNTPAILESLVHELPQLRIYHRDNCGHGQSCLFGYREAINHGSSWVLQIDSDGQCDPRFFSLFWQSRGSRRVLFGNRTTRDDGWKRLLISRCIGTLIGVRTGVWLKDSNVPYRLIDSATLKGALDKTGSSTYFSNIILALNLATHADVTWISIHFRRRTAGQSHFTLSKSLSVLKTLWRDLGSFHANRISGSCEGQSAITRKRVS